MSDVPTHLRRRELYDLAVRIGLAWREIRRGASTSGLRDYLYVPLGGNRHGTLATYRNLITTMVLGGLWHGAALTFLIWGLFHGLGLALERVGAALIGRGLYTGPGLPAGARRWLGRLVTFNVVCVSWVYFRADSLATANELLVRSITAWGPAPLVTAGLVAVIAATVAVQLIPAGIGARVETAFSSLPLPVQGVALGVFCGATIAFGPQGVAPFIYYQF